MKYKNGKFVIKQRKKSWKTKLKTTEHNDWALQITTRPLPILHFRILIVFLHEVDSQLFKSMQNSQHCINCLLPDTRKTAYLRREETTYMNSHIIITAGLRVPLTTGPSTILFFLFCITSNWYTIIVLATS